MGINKNNENYERIMRNFDSAGRIGWGMGALAAAGTYKFFVRANRYLVDQGYGKEYSWLNVGIKLAGVYLGTDVGIKVANMVGAARVVANESIQVFVKELEERKHMKENLKDKEVETNGDGTTSES